jgi:hypothetical protein
MFGKKQFLAALATMSAAALFAQAPAQTPPQTPPQTTTTAAPAAAEVPDGGEPTYLRPETPAQRKARLGTAEDPGPNPDPSKNYWRFGRSYHIEKFERRWESFEGVEPGFVRPFAYVNLGREIYQRNEKYNWVWMPDTMLEPSDQPTTRYNDEQIKYLEKMRPEFSELTPKASAKTIRFEESSAGLPTTGSWRNSMAVADMNGDGCPDIIAPPERKGGLAPAIFLGDCKGHWKYWEGVKWPRGVDYGSVVAADFNKDGHMDVAFGVHLSGIYVMLGDGKGNFRDSSEGLPSDFGTRRIVVADVDGDGYPDIVGLSEGPSVASMAGPPKGRLRVYFNRKAGTQWEELDVANSDKRTAGDWLTLANLTGQRTPDMIAATIYMNSNDVIYVSDGRNKWKSVNDAFLVPFLSYYAANAAGKFSSKKVDDALVSYTRVWPADAPSHIVPDPPIKSIIGIDRLSFAGAQPKRTPVVRYAGSRAIGGMAVGDFDGDGNLDVIYTRSDPRETVILLGDGKGGFTRAKVTGLTLEQNPNYDIKIADVNGDGKPDVILMYESSATTVLASQNGSIHVFLNRGVAPSAMEAKK